MAWPPAVLPINRTDATPQGPATHANDHNLVNGAMNDTTTKLTAVAGDVANLQNAGVAAPKGLIGIAERNTAAGPSTGTTGIAGVTVTTVLTRQRMLSVEFYCRQLSCAAPDAGSIQLRSNGTVIIDGVYVASTSGYAPAIHLRKFVICPAGTYNFEAWVAAGSQAVTISAVSYSPMFLAITDFGDR